MSGGDIVCGSFFLTTHECVCELKLTVMKVNQYTSVAHATKGLRERGFKDEFKLEDPQKMKNLTTETIYKPDDMVIVEFHRFEGISNPSDMSIVFAVETNDGRKGVVISTYGVYANMKLVEFMDKVNIKKKSSTN